MFYQLLISVAVVAGLSVLWIGIQALARRHSGVDCESPDVGMCGGCAHDRAAHCSTRPADPGKE